LLVEGPDRVLSSILHASWSGRAVVLWQAYANAVLGCSIWNWLLARHPASRIAPLALLVPAFGLGASAWYLSEPLQAWKLPPLSRSSPDFDRHHAPARTDTADIAGVGKPAGGEILMHFLQLENILCR
jgi:hypothetical protein